jgi:hypothetical protein
MQILSCLAKFTLKMQLNINIAPSLVTRELNDIQKLETPMLFHIMYIISKCNKNRESRVSLVLSQDP